MKHTQDYCNKYSQGHLEKYENQYHKTLKKIVWIPVRFRQISNLFTGNEKANSHKYKLLSKYAIKFKCCSRYMCKKICWISCPSLEKLQFTTIFCVNGLGYIYLDHNFLPFSSPNMWSLSRLVGGNQCGNIWVHNVVQKIDHYYTCGSIFYPSPLRLVCDITYGGRIKASIFYFENLGYSVT